MQRTHGVFLLKVEIDGKVQAVALTPSSDPEQVASEFSLRNGLKTPLRESLTHHIDDFIQRQKLIFSLSNASESVCRLEDRSPSSATQTHKKTVYDRLFEDAQMKQAKKSPQKRKTSRGGRSLEYLNKKFFYNAQIQAEQHQKELEQLRMESKVPEPELSFRPKLNPSSLRLATGRQQSGSVEDRLLDLGRASSDRRAYLISMR